LRLSLYLYIHLHKHTCIHTHEYKHTYTHTHTHKHTHTQTHTHTHTHTTQEQIAQVRGEIERHRGKNVSADSQRRQELMEAEGQLAATERRTIAYEAKSR
jgi:hypothetical protein